MLTFFLTFIITEINSLVNMLLFCQMKKILLFLLPIFVLAVAIRLLSVWPANTIIGFDQARDLFDSQKIIDGDLRIIGPTAGNNANLHHGVVWLYFIALPLLISKNPISVVIWNLFINSLLVFVLFFLAKDISGNKKSGFVAATLTAVSYYLVSYSGWLSNPAPTLATVPLFFLGVLKYKEGKSWGLLLASFFLGLTIQFELFFLYLIPTFLLLIFILRLKFPKLKILLGSLFLFCLATSTMIATEIKFGFSGVTSLLGAGSKVGDAERATFITQFIGRFFETFAQTIMPGYTKLAIILAVVVIIFLIIKRQWLLLIYLLSPAVMLLLGYHNAPWFLIGLPPAIILSVSLVASKIKNILLLGAVLTLIAFINFTTIKAEYGNGQKILEPDKAAILSSQISAMKYTYESSDGKPFAIDTVTNPLYINVVWAWNYNWYYKYYGYKPSFLGGDQIPPYDTLSKSKEDEKYFFIIIDETPRIPYSHTLSAIASMEKRGKLIEEKEFDGIKVMKFENKLQKQ